MDSPNNTMTSITATKELRALLEITREHRRAAWHHRLLSCLPHAIYTSGEPEIIFNPAGFTYYNLELMAFPDDGSTTTRYTLPELIDSFLINEGVGIAINASDPDRAIDLSYGDVLGFHLYRTFTEPDDHPFITDKPRAKVIGEGVDLLLNDVPEQILPTTTMSLLMAILQHLAIKVPTIKLIYLPETEQYELAFSMDTEQLLAGKSQALMEKIGWFLPRYYSYLACDLSDEDGHQYIETETIELDDQHKTLRSLVSD